MACWMVWRVSERYLGGLRTVEGHFGSEEEAEEYIEEARYEEGIIYTYEKHEV